MSGQIIINRATGVATYGSYGDLPANAAADAQAIHADMLWQSNGLWRPTTPGFTATLVANAGGDTVVFDGPAGNDVPAMEAAGWTKTGNVTTEVVGGDNVIQFSSSAGAVSLVFSPASWGDGILFVAEAKLITSTGGDTHNSALIRLADGSRMMDTTLNRTGGEVGFARTFSTVAGIGSADLGDFERFFGIMHRDDPPGCCLMSSDGVPFAVAGYADFSTTATDQIFLGAASATGNVWQLRRFMAWTLTAD